MRVFVEDEITTEEQVRWALQVLAAALTLWDEERYHTIMARVIQSCREAGLLAQLLIPVNGMALLTSGGAILRRLLR